MCSGVARAVVSAKHSPPLHYCAADARTRQRSTGGRPKMFDHFWFPSSSISQTVLWRRAQIINVGAALVPRSSGYYGRSHIINSDVRPPRALLQHHRFSDCWPLFAPPVCSLEEPVKQHRVHRVVAPCRSREIGRNKTQEERR